MLPASPFQPSHRTVCLRSNSPCDGGNKRLEAQFVNMKKPPAPRRERGDAVTADQTEGSDAEVIERSLLEPEIFGTIFERHFSRICRYLRRRLGGALADELASETFAVAFDVRGGYDPSHPDAGPWLFGIATNLFRRHLRTERRQWNAFARYGID